MNTEIVEYNITDSAISDLRSQYAEVSDIKVVTAALSYVRSLRTDVENRRKELKQDALEWGRKVDGEAKRITALLLQIEGPLKITKKEHDDEKERIRAEKARVEKERVDAIEKQINNFNEILSSSVHLSVSSLEIAIQAVTVSLISDDFDYQEYKEKAKSTKEHVLAQLEKILQTKVEEEQKRAAESAERERIRAELEAQRIENAKREEALRLEREELRKQQEEQQRIAAEAQRKAQEELAKQQAEIDARRKEQEAKEAALEAERQKLEAAKPEPRNIMNVQQRMQLDPNEPKDAKDMVSILRSEYEELFERSEFLGFLEDAGVDNWDGYDQALEMQKEAKNGA